MAITKSDIPSLLLPGLKTEFDLVLSAARGFRNRAINRDDSDDDDHNDEPFAKIRMAGLYSGHAGICGRAQAAGHAGV